MLDEDEKEEIIPLESITFSTETRDRGSYIILVINSSETSFPLGSLEFYKSDPNHKRKIELFKSSIIWLNSFLKGETGRS